MGAATHMRNSASHATFGISGQAFEVHALYGSEAISTLFRYEIHCRCTLPLPAAPQVIGAEGVLTLVDAEGRSHALRGFVAEASGRAFDDESGEIRFVLRPHVFDLTLGRAARAFQESTLLDILKTVLGRHAGSTRFAFPAGNPIAYRVERGESDWAFLERNLLDAGLLYWFDHDAGSTLVIAAGLDAATPLEGAPIPVLTESYIGGITEGIVELASENSAGFSAHAARGFRWEKPALDVSAKAGSGAYESYEYVLEVPNLKSVGDGLMKQAGARANRQRIAGVVRSIRGAPGVALPIRDQESIDGRFVITSRSLTAELDGGGSPFLSFTYQFEGIHESGTPHPSPAAPHRPHVGLSHAIVSASAGDEVYPNEAGQIRAQLHWDRGGQFDEKAGTWMRVAQRFAPGSMMFPRTGWVLATIGQRGSSDVPAGLGRIFDGEHPPSYALPANKTRVVYKTATTPGGGSFNEIHFEDKKGGEVLHIHASRDTEILTQSGKSEFIHNDATHEVEQQQVIKVEASKFSEVLLNQTTVIGRDEKIETGGDMNRSTSNDESITIGGQRNVRGKMNHSTTVAKNRSLKVGAALIDISLGEITREAKNALTLVGGVLLRIAGQSITRRVGPAWIETVGGMKYTKSGQSVMVSSGKNMTETIGGSVVLKAGTNINEDSTESGTWTVLGTFQGESKESLIEANDKIEIRCGKSILQVDPEGLTLSADQIELNGEELELVTAVIEHN
jgi:type VI secretion system secreted protein VgrG